MPGATVAGMARPMMVPCAGLVQSSNAAETAERRVEEKSILMCPYGMWDFVAELVKGLDVGVNQQNELNALR